jgi:hypothetical protein
VHADDTAAVVVVGAADVVTGPEDADVDVVGGVVTASDDAAGLEELSHAAPVRITATAMTRCRVFMHGACLTRVQRHGRLATLASARLS